MSRTKWPGGWFKDAEDRCAHYYSPSDEGVESICGRMYLLVTVFNNTAELLEYNTEGRHCLWCEQALVRREQELRGER